MSDELKDDGGGEAKRDQAQPQPSAPPEPPPAPKAKWPWIVGGLVVLVFIAGVLLVVLLPNAKVTTNAAYVMSHFATVTPRVAGQISRIAVDDNQAVHRGDLLVELDPRDLQAALDQAQAQLAQDRAEVARAQAQVNRQPALIDQSTAQIQSARATVSLGQANADRYRDLAQTGASSIQQRQQYDATLRQSQAQLTIASADRRAAREQLTSLRADLGAAIAKVQADEASVRQAKLNLSYTRIVAPIDGTVDQRSAQIGNTVSMGAALITIVPLNAVYVEANYREVDLRHMRPGDAARIHLDAYDVWLEGAVVSLPPSSGAAYSPIPPNNANGNFTKVVQRLPVKISLLPNQRFASLLRVGMSVETTVDTGLHDVVGDQPRPPLATGS